MMKIFTRGYFLLSLVLLFACGGGNDSAQNLENKDKKDSSATQVEALENFDHSYLGKLNGSMVQLNLRRYGNDLSGTYWLRDSDSSYAASGSVNGDAFELKITNKNNQGIINLKGNFTSEKGLKGKWTDGQKDLDFEMAKFDDSFGLNLKFDAIKVERNSGNGARTLFISYPQIAGISDESIARRVNFWIEDYFESSTKLKQIEDKNQNFKEDVKYDITYLGKEIISICKNHHLAKNNDTQLFDDSHGLNLNFKRAKIYELRDLFKPNGFDALNKIILEKVNKACGNGLDEATLEKCKVSPSETTCFSLAKEKITFHLTERLPYKLRGCGYVRIEYKELKDLFNPSGPLNEVSKAQKM
jgi:hypothetical protein